MCITNRLLYFYIEYETTFFEQGHMFGVAYLWWIYLYNKAVNMSASVACVGRSLKTTDCPADGHSMYATENTDPQTSQLNKTLDLTFSTFVDF